MMNNKGFTTVEVLVCFVIVSVVMMTMFTTISSFNDKRILESNRAKIYEYKNEITNLIQEDIVNRGLLFAKFESATNTGEYINKATLTFADGEEKVLEVYQKFTKTEFHQEGNDASSDSFYISYGTSLKMIRYDLPDLGSVMGEYDSSEEKFIAKKDGYRKALDLQINTVEMYVSNISDPNNEAQVLNIYIGFYHPDFGSKYAINIAAPLNYHFNSANQKWPVSNSNTNSTSEIYIPND